MDERISLTGIDLAAHAADVDVDDIGHRIEMQIPHMLQKHRPGHDTALVAYEIFEHLKLSRQQVDFLVPAGYRPRHQVEFEIADAQNPFLAGAFAAPNQRLDPRNQLREGEWLDEVIVAARPQAAHAFVDLAERADDQ